MIVIPFKKEHLKTINVQDAQKGLEHIEDDAALTAVEREFSFTVIDGDKVVACGGVACVARGRGVAWSYLSNNLKKEMVFITRTVKEYMRRVPFHRIEAHVDCNYEQAHRWARLLGFKLECERMEAFTPDKRDCALYAIVR